jgi:hypothetical protein
VFENFIGMLGKAPALVYTAIAVRFSDDPSAARIGARAALVRYLLPRLALPLIAGALVSFLSDFGDEVSVGFFAALAQVLPVLALAGFVESLSAVRGQLSDDEITLSPSEEKEISMAFIQLWVYAFVGYLVIGEAAALWAIGDRHSSTFLLVATCVCALLMVQAITEAHMQRYRSVLDKRVAAATLRAEEMQQTPK